MWRNRIFDRVTPRGILIAGWLLFAVYAYPGYMSYDSAWQLGQARGLDPFSDWHPPMMALIWRILDTIIAGPVLMLVLQSVTFLLGSYVLLGRVMSKRAAAITAAVVLVLPQNIHVMAVIWKDSQMAGLLLAGAACLTSASRKWRLVGYGFIFFATAFRYNAAAPTFPLILCLFDAARRMGWVKRYVAATGIWVGLTILALLANAAITDVKLHPWPTGSASVDIYGIIKHSKLDTKQLIESHPDVPWAHTDDMDERVQRWYRPTNSYLHAMEGEAAIFHYPANPTQRDALGKLFFELVREYPGAYAQHRWAAFVAQVNMRIAVWEAFMPDQAWTDRLHNTGTHSPIQRKWVKGVMWIEHLRIMRPVVYLLVSLLLIFLARRERIAFALFASGIAHELALLPLAPAIDYRYSHWMVCATILGTIVLFVRRRQGTA